MTNDAHEVAAITLTRREVLLLGAIVAGMGGTSCGREETRCVEEALLSTGERSLRHSRHYTDASPHGESRRCVACEFFEPAPTGACGSCSILGGPVASTGHCDSFSPRTQARRREPGRPGGPSGSAGRG